GFPPWGTRPAGVVPRSSQRHRYGAVFWGELFYSPPSGRKDRLPVGLLETIRTPQDLHRLTRGQMRQLAQEVRAFLIANVSRTGGHLGPNLGVVELTLAIHRSFDSPRDA